MEVMFNYEFLKLEFKKVYSYIDNIIKEKSEGRKEKIDEFIKYILDSLAVKNNRKGLIHKNVLITLEELRVEGIIPKDIHSSFYNLREKSENEFRDIYKIAIWYALEFGEENYTLIYDNLEKCEKEVFDECRNIHQNETFIEDNEIEGLSIFQCEDIGEIEKSEEYLKEAQEYYLGKNKNKNYKMAFEKFKKASKLGNNYADAYIGLFYDKGYYVEKSKKEAFKYYTKAALGGNPFAQYILGYSYLTGNGLEKSYENAVYWLQKSCEYEYIPAISEMGKIYYLGLGVKVDNDKAFTLYHKAAEAGYSPAQYSLAYMYKNGHGCQQNSIKAYYWLEKSAENNYEDSYFLVGEYYLKGMYLEENYKKAFEYLNKGAKIGSGKALESLGDMYYYGYHVDKNQEKAIEMYKESIRKGNLDVYIKLASIYRKKKFYRVAIYYYEKGAANKNSICNEELGIIYLDGEMGDPDVEKALSNFKIASMDELEYSTTMVGYIYFKHYDKYKEDYKIWFEKAYKQGSSNAAFFLGRELLLEYYKGKSNEVSKILEYNKFAAERGVNGAIYHLGIIHEDGIGVRQNKNKGFVYYREAADKGDGKAMLKIANSLKIGDYYNRNIEYCIDILEKVQDEYKGEALEELVNIYEFGIGGKFDAEKAFKISQKLYNKDKIRGSKKLCKFYLMGFGVDKNIKKGEEYLNKLKELNLGEYYYLIGLLLECEIEINTELTVEEAYGKSAEMEVKEARDNFLLYIGKNQFEKWGDKKTQVFLKSAFEEKSSKGLLAKEIVLYKRALAKKSDKEAKNSIIKIEDLISKGVWEGIETVYEYYTRGEYREEEYKKILYYIELSKYYNINVEENCQKKVWDKIDKCEKQNKIMKITIGIIAIIIAILCLFT